MDEKMDIQQFIRTLKRRYVTVAAVTVTVLLLTVLVTVYVMKPTYEVNENIVVGNLNTSENYSESQQLNMLLASTIDFIKSPTVMSEVTRETGLGYEEIDDRMIIQNTKDSQIINVIVRDEDPEQAARLSGLIAETTVEKMDSLFGVGDIVILSDPGNDSQVQQVGGVLLNIGIGFVIGVLAGIGAAMFRDHMDDSFRSSAELATMVDIPVLGDIDMKKGRVRAARIDAGKEVEPGVIDEKERRKVSV
ncbi:Wzz/FepE/Etk N-terminal domain-containing protein [Salimicrobium sp. PL1-032A]|uniref:YveK family protein n=1 Tax=Salimicrobium sp. PL1-032A TaxID=3095364 RepID=UPI003260D111